jgi:hypothetical protein
MEHSRSARYGWGDGDGRVLGQGRAKRRRRQGRPGFCRRKLRGPRGRARHAVRHRHRSAHLRDRRSERAALVRFHDWRAARDRKAATRRRWRSRCIRLVVPASIGLVAPVLAAATSFVVLPAAHSGAELPHRPLTYRIIQGDSQCRGRVGEVSPRLHFSRPTTPARACARDCRRMA